MEQTTDETRNLRRCVRELAALSVLSAAWGRTGPQGIADSLAEVLLRSLPHADFAYVRVKDPSDDALLGAVRASQPFDPTRLVREMGEALGPPPEGGYAESSQVVANPVGEGEVRLAVVPIGYEGDCGVVVAGCRQPDFPGPTDRLLLGVAANQAAVVLQHRRSEEALRRHSALLHEERELLRVTLASIGDAVIATDTGGRVTFLNPVAQDLTGWTEEEARGRPLEAVFRIVHEQTRRPVENPVVKVLRDGGVVGLGNHTVLIARDGTERPIDDSAAPIMDTAGSAAGVILVFRDVTGQRHAENELRASEARKGAILETALDCIITMDHRGRVVEFNPAAEKTFGFVRSDVIGKELAGLIIPPSLRERHRSGMARYLATGEGPVLGRRLELPALRADGTEFPAELAITRIPTDGLPLFTAYLRDISDRERQERHRNARLAVTQVLAQAACIRDAATGVLRAVCESLGWDVGFFWTLRPNADALNCLESWHRPGAPTTEFEAASRRRTFGRGEGLPGHVWATGEPHWIFDVVQDPNFPRVAPAAGDGLHGGFGCPIVAGAETLGVIEFFSQQVREPDADLLEVMATVAGQVRQFVDRTRAEEERNRFFTVGTDMLVVAGFDGYLKRVNPAWEEALGWTAEELTGQPWLYFVHPDDRAATEAEGERLLRGEEVVSFENRYRTKAGEYRWLDWKVRPFPEERLLYGGATDITGRKRGEAALRESEEKLRLLADTIPQLAWMARPDGHIFWYNRRWYEYTGTTPEQMEGWGWQSVHDPATLPAVLERWRGSIASGEPFDMVFPLKGADGRFRPFLTRVNPLRGEQGRILYWFGTNTDISEQKRAEDASRFLAEAGAALAAVVDYESTLGKVANLAVPYFADWSAVDVADDDGSLRRLAVAHRNADKVGLAHDLMRQYPPDPGSLVGIVAVWRKGKPEIVAEITDDMLVRGAKDERHLGLMRSLGLKSYICVPLIVSGNPLGVLTFATAESGRTYTAADLALAVDLAQRVGVAVENTRLYQALRDADRRKDEFLATLAHELRNPLAPIRNSLQILKMPRVDAATAQRSREMLERQVHHLVRLVDDLLDVSRVMQGKIELRRERVELAAVVARAVETVQPLIDAQGHELTVHLPTESLPLDADPVRLAQVVGNLLTNAAKYTEPGGHIRLTAGREGGEAVLRIRDDGIGIAPDVLPHVFELFVQVDHAATRSQGGLGIGLTLVKNLCEMHGGSVEAKSAGLGEGCEFVVRLPLSTGTVRKVDGPEPGHAETVPPSGHRLLVVDDNRDAADSLAMLLRLQGHEVRVAHSGPEALEATKTYTPDVVFLDIGMPGMDGYEVARRMRRQPGMEKVVLAALTGWGQQEDRRRTAEAGFDHHLVKPPEPKLVEGLLADFKRPDLG